MSDYKEQS